MKAPRLLSAIWERHAKKKAPAYFLPFGRGHIKWMAPRLLSAIWERHVKKKAHCLLSAIW